MQKKTAAWQKADRHYWHPFSDNKELRAQGSRLIVRGDGVHVWDSEGRRLLDGMSGLWCVNLGYGRAELVDAAARQMRELPYYNSFFKCANPPAVELAAKLAKIAPRGMGNVFFTGSGSERHRHRDAHRPSLLAVARAAAAQCPRRARQRLSRQQRFGRRFGRHAVYARARESPEILRSRMSRSPTLSGRGLSTKSIRRRRAISPRSARRSWTTKSAPSAPAKSRRFSASRCKARAA